jgi:hypothetical protein
MRFKGTFTLLLVCIALGAYVYFYEIKGGEKREKAKEAESQVWKFDSADVEQIDIQTASSDRITARRSGAKNWVLTAPHPYDADSDELDRIANSASNLRRENVVEENAGNISKFGLSPARVSLSFRTKNGKEYKIDFGNDNPTASSAYAVLPPGRQVFLVTSTAASAFNKKLEDLRNHAVLSFEQSEVQSLTLKNSKGDVALDKDSSDRWWIRGNGTVAADGPDVRGILTALSLARAKEFLAGNAGDYTNLGLDKPLIDVSLTYGKNKAIKHLIIGAEKSRIQKKGEKAAAPASGAATAELYAAKDESRPDVFFVEKELVDKLTKSRGDLRDKALAAFQRWDVDFIALTNQKGDLTFNKSGGEWFLSDSNKKAKWDAINGVLDGLEKPVKKLIEKPAALSAYGLDKPLLHVILKQSGNVLVDCAFGKAAKEGIYAQVKGDLAVKIADPESLNNLNNSASDFVDSQEKPKTK